MTEEDEINDKLPLLPEKPVRINYTKRYDQVSWHSADTDFEPDPSVSSADERYRKTKKPAYSKRRKQKIAALVIVVVIFLSVMAGLIYMYVERGDNYVEISCGKLTGVNEDDVFVYKGVPYAKSPINDLRWQKTVPFGRKHCWKDIFKAKTFKNPCLGRRDGSEDCLSLNVYTPVEPKAEKPLLPVIVYFMSELLSQNIDYSKSYLPTAPTVKEVNAVVVTVNYRTDIFGFLSLDVLWNGTNEYGNFGLYDQLASLDWVKENIKAFGGNPSSVTIIGRTSIFALLSSPLAQGKFQKAFVFSGSTKFNTTFNEASILSKQYLTTKGKCQSLDGSELKQCLYSLSPKELLADTSLDDDARWDFPSSSSETENLIGIVTEPNLFPYPPKSLPNHEYPKVSVIIGNTAQEVGLKSKVHVKSWYDFQDVLSKRLKAFGSNFSNINRLYSNKTSSNQTIPLEVLYQTISSDVRLICPTNKLLREMKNSKHNVFYRYIYKSGGDLTSSQHGADILSLFDLNSKAGKILRDNLKHFIEYGHPLQFAWDTSKTFILSDDGDIELISEEYHEKQCEFWNDPLNGFVGCSWSN